jgi:hypothetical protein
MRFLGRKWGKKNDATCKSNKISRFGKRCPARMAETRGAEEGSEKPVPERRDSLSG